MKTLPVLEFQDVSMIYNSIDGETLALDRFSYAFEKGGFTAIVGPSGCGKSTLLSLAAGLLRPDEGQVLFEGEKVCQTMPQIGYMLQRDHLFDWLTIEENACLGLRVRKLLNKDARERVRSLLCACGLGDFIKSYPSQLSGGMRQRAALVRTLALDPELLLLDESFSALDYQTRLSVSQDVSRIIHERHKTAILVTHDISEAIALADTVIVLTKRPGTVKSVHKIGLSGSPIERRSLREFNVYFNTLWKELDVHV